MKIFYSFVIFLIGSFLLTGQTTTDFENFGLSVGESNNNAPDGTFTSGNVSLFNNNPGGFWEGWAISAQNDTLTPGFMNDLSVIAGEGAEGSTSFAVTYAFSPQKITLTGDAIGGVVQGMYVNNNTYAYLGIRDGVGPATAFGGMDGNAPDFYLLTIKAIKDGELKADSVDFYLADYRFDNNDDDYIVKDWTYIDLTSLGNVDELQISLSSSDNGEFGMNTPAYVCVDNIITADMPVGTNDQRLDWTVNAYPNPTADLVRIDWPVVEQAKALLYDAKGTVVKRLTLTQGTNQLDMSMLSQGHYTLFYRYGTQWNAQSLLRQ